MERKGKVLEVEKEFVSHYPWRACPPSGHKKTPLQWYSCTMLLTGEKLSKLPVQKGNTNSNHIQEKEGLIGDYYPDGSPWGTHTYMSTEGSCPN